MRRKTKLFRYLRIWIVAFFIVPTAFSCIVSADTVDSFDNHLQAHLAERAEQYLKTLHARTTELSPRRSERFDRRAQVIVQKGFAQFSRPNDLGRKQDFAPADFGMISETFRLSCQSRLTKSHLAALRFLSHDFHQPTKWDVAVRAALSNRLFWERVHGVLTRHRAGENPFFTITGGPGTANSRAVTRSSSGKSFDVKSLLKAVSIGISAFEFKPACSVKSNDLLVGAPLIVRTIVLRN